MHAIRVERPFENPGGGRDGSMNQDPLQQLRDIHLPPEPGWWPPAIGWWLLALALAAALTWLAWRLAARWRRFRPARAARALYREVSRDLGAGVISPLQYLHRTSELLKRFAVHGLQDTDMAPESGNGWLRYLDGRYGQPAFSRGPGRCLGVERFRPELNPDTRFLDGLIGRFFARECARFWRLTGTGPRGGAAEGAKPADLTVRQVARGEHGRTGRAHGPPQRQADDGYGLGSGS